MPVYDYECSECNTKFEQRQSFDDKPVAVCPKCGNGARRVFHPVPILFKGSGFYSTDHGKRGVFNSSPKESEPESASETKSGTDDTTKESETATATKSQVETKVGEGS
ncbi:MAG: zinc ribbon domain-containing protein [Chloroflexota bacterium]|nr:zinc ribbon domain-containing protein [Chloroflexota bacterium]